MKARDWSKVLAPWIARRKVDGAPLRKEVWDNMAPLRAALGSDKT